MACNNKTHSRGRVAFSWENKPGVCKAAVAPPHGFCDGDDPLKKQLQPPPCTPARKGNKKLQKDGGAEDPFLAAYKECTSEDDEKTCPLANWILHRLYLVSEKQSGKGNGFDKKNMYNEQLGSLQILIFVYILKENRGLPLESEV
ncbi:hypothetical protein Csa_012691 [Cucumis sativus]|nr:hypothetical protein Csa_012691 [Cucumis sativus]